MEFINFCQALGIVINTPPPLGVWRRYPTVDHPRKRNGAVKWMGDHGFAQNHALDTEVSVWKDDKVTEGAKRDFQKLANEAEMERLRMQKNAADKAATILKQCQFGKHEYLKAKGFDDEEGNIWAFDGKQFLIIPMRVDGHLVGLQIIDNEGAKKFLYGQRTAGAEFCFDNKGPHILCEGYATGLSIRKALKNMKKRYTIHVCFSAGNMKKIATGLPGGFVVADCDASSTGEKIAKEIGWPYWIAPEVGFDFNDFHQKHGLFAAAYSLTNAMRANSL